MSIPLPPIPEPYIDTWPLTPEKLRARDLEVARVVLEAAALIADSHGVFGTAKSIRALEFKHHE